MSDGAVAAAPVDAPAAPVEAKAPLKPPVAKAPEPEPSEEYEIDGEKVTLTRTQARTEIQKSRAAAKRMQEATEKQRKLDADQKEFEEDPEAYYRKRGKDPEKVFAEHLAKKARQALMTPEQVESERQAKELAELKADKAKTEAEKKAAADKELDDRNSIATERQLIAGADKYGLDATPDTLEGLCDTAAKMMDDFGVIPTVDQVMQEYLFQERQGIETRDRKVTSKLEGKKLLSYLGPDVLAKVKAALALADVESLKAIPSPQTKKPPQQNAPTKRDAQGKYVREADFDRKFGL